MYLISEGTLLPTQNILQKFKTEVFPEDFDPEYEYEYWDDDEDAWYAMCGFEDQLDYPDDELDEEIFERPHERYSVATLRSFEEGLRH